MRPLIDKHLKYDGSDNDHHDALDQIDAGFCTRYLMPLTLRDFMSQKQLWIGRLSCLVPISRRTNRWSELFPTPKFVLTLRSEPPAER